MSSNRAFPAPGLGLDGARRFNDLADTATAATTALSLHPAPRPPPARRFHFDRSLVVRRGSFDRCSFAWPLPRTCPFVLDGGPAATGWRSASRAAGPSGRGLWPGALLVTPSISAWAFAAVRRLQQLPLAPTRASSW